MSLFKSNSNAASVTDPPPEGKKYWAFLSYSHQDTITASRIRRQLENYPIRQNSKDHEDADTRTENGEAVTKGTDNSRFPRRLYPIFQDRDEIPSSRSLDKAIFDALAASHALLVICSPRSAQSKWVDQEIREFKKSGRDDQIHYLVVDGEPNATTRDGVSADLECFPPAARFEVDANGELTDRPVDPAAPDMRKQRDGKDKAQLKLISGIADIPLDYLNSRDAEYQRERLRKTQLAVTAFALLAAIAIVAGAFAFHQRNQALLALARSDFQYGSEKIEKGETGEGAAYLARALRHRPDHIGAKQRLFSLLGHRHHLLPRHPPIRVGRRVFRFTLLPDGSACFVEADGLASDDSRFRSLPDGKPVQVINSGGPNPEGNPFWTLNSVRSSLGDKENVVVYASRIGPSKSISVTDEIRRWSLKTGEPDEAFVELPSGKTIAGFVVDRNGKNVAWWSNPGNQIHVASLESGKVVGNSIQLEEPVYSAVLLPDNQGLLTVDQAGGFDRWDVTNGKSILQKIPDAEMPKIRSLHETARGVLFVVDGMSNANTRLWSFLLLGGAEVGSVRDPDFVYRDFEIDSTGTFAMGITWDQQTHLFMLGEDSRPLSDLIRHLGPYPPRFLPDLSGVITQDDANLLVIRSLAKGNTITLFEPESILLTELSQDGRFAVGGNKTGELRLFDAMTGLPLRAGFPASEGEKWTVAKFSPDSKMLAAGGNKGSLLLIDTSDLEVIHRRSGSERIFNLEWSSTSSAILVDSLQNGIQLVEADTGDVLRNHSADDAFRLPRFLPSGREYLVSDTGQIRAFPADGSKESRDIGLSLLGLISDVAISPDEAWIAVGSFESVSLRPFHSPTSPRFNWPNDQAVKDLFFLGEDTKWLCGVFDDEIRVWDIRSGQEVGSPILPGRVKHAEGDPTGGVILVSTMDSKAQLWDWRSGRPLSERLDATTEARFGADGQALIRTNATFQGEITLLCPAEASPRWLGPLTEVVFGSHLDNLGVLHTVRANRWDDLLKQIESNNDTDQWSQFGRWFTASDPETRTIHFQSNLTLKEFIEKANAMTE